MKNCRKLIAFVTAAIMLVTVVALAACSQPTQLAAPQIKLEGNKVTWSAVPNADSYDVKVGSKAAVNVKTTEYTITETAQGSYDVTVVAKSSDANYLDSAASNKVTYTVNPAPQPTQLATPSLTLAENVVSWTAVAHADKYFVKVNDETGAAQTGLSYTVDKTEPGSYVVSVVAQSNNTAEYTDSQPATITYTVEAPAGLVVTTQGYVVIPYNSGWSVNWENFDFSSVITATLDNESVAYSELTVTAAGTTYGEEALTLTVKKGDVEAEPVKLDVYYGIADAAQFKLIKDDLSGWYMVTAEISEGGWIDPLGVFTGHLNGNYKKIAITGIGEAGSGYDHGLFNGNEGVIENLVLVAEKQVYANGRVAAVAGYNKGTIQNCYVKFGFVGGANCTAGITWGADESESSTGTIIGCVFIGEVYAETTQPYVNHAGIVGSSGTGGTKDCLYIVTPCPDTAAGGHSTHGTEPADTVAVGSAGANDSNNAAIAYNKLTFSQDGSQYWSSDAEGTKYDNNLTEEIYNLVKEYLRQLTAA